MGEHAPADIETGVIPTRQHLGLALQSWSRETLACHGSARVKVASVGSE